MKEENKYKIDMKSIIEANECDTQPVIVLIIGLIFTVTAGIVLLILYIFGIRF